MERRKKIKSQYPNLLPVFCVAGSLTLYLVLFLVNKREMSVQGITELERNVYGGANREVELLIDGLESDTKTLSVEVKAREYTEEEAQIVFEAVIEEIDNRILGENLSLSEVRSDLNLISFWEAEGIRLRWLSSIPDIINAQGQITGTDMKEQGEAGYLSVRLSAGHYYRDYEIPIKVFPPVYDRSAESYLPAALSIQSSGPSASDSHVFR